MLPSVLATVPASITAAAADVEDVQDLIFPIAISIGLAWLAWKMIKRVKGA